MTLFQKLRTTIHEHELLNRGDTLVVGVSGGPDSLTLLHALRGIAPELELKLLVGHLNHQLRGEESDADEQFVVSLAREWGLPVANASWDVRGYAQETGLSIEEAARNLRYQFLLGAAKRVKANAIAVAHNADDQVETILLHFLRGAGLTGLRGMAYKSGIQIAGDGGQGTGDGRQEAGGNNQSEASPQSSAMSVSITKRTSHLIPQHSVALIRPLLDVTRGEIENYCVENNLQPREDKTNLDRTILRNRLRHEVIPYLETINPNLREVLRHSALSVTDDYDYIHQNVLGIFERMMRAANGALVFDRKWFRALPVNLQRGVLREAVSRLRRVKNIGYQHIESARRVAADKDAGAEATLPQGLLLVVGYDDFTIGEHLPLPDAPLLLHGETMALDVGDERLLEGSDWAVRVRTTGDRGRGTRDGGRTTNLWVGEFDGGKIRGKLNLRTRRAGERFCPVGMGGKHKSLHEFMIDEKIPRHLREFVPVLADDEKVLWVVGYRQDERSAVGHGDEAANMIRVEFFKNLEWFLP